MAKTNQKVVFGLWSNIGVADLNRLLKTYGVRLVAKRSKEWGDQVTITAQMIDTTWPGLIAGLEKEANAHCARAAELARLLQDAGIKVPPPDGIYTVISHPDPVLSIEDEGKRHADSLG